LYVPQTVHAAWGSLGERHCGHGTVATARAFHWDRRERVLLRDILRLGTATELLLGLQLTQRGPPRVDLLV
jgi:hypothetical protein